MPSAKSATKSKSSSAKKSSGKKSNTKSTSPVESVVAPVEPQATPVESVAAPVVAPVAAPVESTVTASDGSSEVSLLQVIEADFASLTERLAQFKSMYTSITSDLRKLQKNMAKHVRENSRKNRKRKAPSDKKRPPSGFAKPTVISDELCKFLKVSPGTEMARTEVTKHLTEYIKTHELQDKDNRRKIVPDNKLKTLLNIPKGEDLTYFNLQKYMKGHFPKSAAAIAAAEQSSA